MERARNLKKLTVPPEASLTEVMRVIDREKIELCFVAKGDGSIVGTLSDGDVRRAILRGTPLHTPAAKAAMNRRFRFVDVHTGRAEVLDLMRALSIGVVPVLDSQHMMVGLHLLHDLIGAASKPNVAVIMAGGKGTRLRPLTYDIPKPMLPVAGRPILERLVLQLVGSGIRRIFLAINYLGHVIEAHFGDGHRFGCEITYLREKKPLGTGGPLSLLPAEATQYPVFVMNGDLVTEIDMNGLLEFHNKTKVALTVSLKPYRVEIPYGVAEVRGTELLHIREKPSDDHLVNAGIYVVAPRALKLVPRNASSTMLDLFEACRMKRLKVGAYPMNGSWVDVGQPEALAEARGHR
jgi:dTDP-glucose pyrophosphorylase